MMELYEIVTQAAALKASDLHLTVGMPPIFRIDGVLQQQGTERLTEEDISRAVSQLADEEIRERFRVHGEADFSTTFRGSIRMRCAVFRQQGHTAAALRLLPLRVPTVEELQIPPVLVEQAEKPRGLILVTGPTGSGKSSTLAALLNHVNQMRPCHIITLENPIEYIYTPDRAMINQREIGPDTASFAAGLRAALRQDPDVILVGEMRDLETISTAIAAAETGHLVFATLHAKGAANTIDRIVDVYPTEQQEQIRVQLADVLECVVAQSLLPRVGGGRRAVHEILVAVPAVRNLIRQNKTFQITSTMQTGKRLGMQLLDEALADLVRRGEVTLDAAINVANDPAALRTLCGR